MNIFIARLAIAFLVATVLSLSAAAQSTLGQIKTARIEGEVSKVAADGAQTPLKNGDLILESDTVVTGDKGSVVLVFQNGSTIRLAPASRLKIEEFKMDPLAEGTDLATVTEEPSPSQTKLDLTYGEIVGNVKKLRGTSNYNIKTPAGAAGIRGTTFRIIFRPTGDGKSFNFQITTTDGRVVFASGTTGNIAGAAASDVEVPAGKEIVLTVDVNPQTGVVTIPTTVVTGNVSQQTVEAVTAVATQATQAAAATVFSATPPSPPPPPSGNQDNSSQKDQQKDQPKEQVIQQAIATQTAPNLTPGAGGG